MAFEEFRLPVFDMSENAFMDKNKFDVFRFGRPPVAIDIITDLKGMNFEKCFKNAVQNDFEGVKIRYLNYNDLIDAKRASGRPKDINDIDNLQK